MYCLADATPPHLMLSLPKSWSPATRFIIANAAWVAVGLALRQPGTPLTPVESTISLKVSARTTFKVNVFLDSPLTPEQERRLNAFLASHVGASPEVWSSVSHDASLPYQTPVLKVTVRTNGHRS